MAYMTQEGYDKMVAMLRQMEQIERPAASAAIAEARDKGDLSENAEYDAAKEAQAELETKIAELKAQIHSAKIIDTSRIRTDVAQILSTVEMRNVKSGTKMKYTIVSEKGAELVRDAESSAFCGHKGRPVHLYGGQRSLRDAFFLGQLPLPLQDRPAFLGEQPLRPGCQHRLRRHDSAGFQQNEGIYGSHQPCR